MNRFFTMACVSILSLATLAPHSEAQSTNNDVVITLVRWPYT